MSTMQPIYTATVSVTGGRQGHAVSDDGVLDVQLRVPKTNGVTEGTNPEQLFAAAWGGCFQSALMGAAQAMGVDASGSTVRVQISQGSVGDGDYRLAAKIMVAIPGVPRETAQELAKIAHAGCPYSKATRGNIDVEVSVA